MDCRGDLDSAQDEDVTTDQWLKFNFRSVTSIDQPITWTYSTKQNQTDQVAGAFSGFAHCSMHDMIGSQAPVDPPVSPFVLSSQDRIEACQALGARPFLASSLASHKHGSIIPKARAHSCLKEV